MRLLLAVVMLVGPATTPGPALALEAARGKGRVAETLAAFLRDNGWLQR